MPPRFIIRRRPDRSLRAPWILKDRKHPAYLSQSRTFERAILKMENRVRAELDLPPRLTITTAEIMAEMEKRA